MGVNTAVDVGANAGANAGMRTLGSRVWLVRAGWASLVANVLLVVTGGAVRLSGSGLGCPTWPRCHGGSFTPHGEANIHSAIEFTNRMLTVVLTVVAIATVVIAWRSGRREMRRLGIGLILFIPFQIVLGGITVLSHLNPWIVSFHLLSSMAIIGLAVVFLWRIDRTLPTPTPLAWATFAAAWAVLYLGTVVTGSGPHAGDIHAKRNGLSPLQTAQFHADLVFLLVGLTVALLLLGRTRAAVWLFVIEMLQGVIGYTQYFTHLPDTLVGIHMFGAALVSAAVTWMLLASGDPTQEPRQSVR
jgi:cytochrome c oxidase assembly protein subunit 15